MPTPTEPPIDPAEALTIIRTLIGDLEYAMGEKAVDMTLNEVRRVLERSIPPKRRRRTAGATDNEP